MRRGLVWTLSTRLTNAAIFAAFFVCAASADEAVITSKGGALELSGRIIGFDGTYLTIESPYGPLTLPFDQVECLGEVCPGPENYIPELRFSGSSGMAELLLPALFDGFARDQGWQIRQDSIESASQSFAFFDDAGPRLILHVRSSTTDEGFADFVAFETDIVMADREATAEDIARAREVGAGRLDEERQARIVALDGLVPVVSPFLAVERVGLEDLSRLIAGQVNNWERIGGPDQPVSVHLVGPADGLTQRFIQMVLTAVGREVSETVVWHQTRQEMLAAVTEDHGAVGVASFRETGLTKPIALVDRCGFAMTPRLLSLKTEDYPLTAPLILYLPERRLPEAANAFFRYLRTSDAQLIVRRANFVDPGAVPIPLDAQGQRFAKAIASAGTEVSLEALQEMVASLLKRTRLSTSFRFEAGAVNLDAQSGANLLVLAQDIRDGKYADRSLLFAGFTDGRGSAEANRALSLSRAETVRDALLSIVGNLPEDVSLDVAGFGETLPMGCDDTIWGRQVNRRVELWVSE